MKFKAFLFLFMLGFQVHSAVPKELMPVLQTTTFISGVALIVSNSIALSPHSSPVIEKVVDIANMCLGGVIFLSAMLQASTGFDKQLS